MNLPPMTVELRQSDTAHGIPAPDTSPENMALQIEQAIILNEAAKVGGWSPEALEILTEYVSTDKYDDIMNACEDVLKMSSWREVVIFVQDDMCLDFFNLALAYCLREGQAHKKEKGFIDGSGIGYVKAYITRLKKTLEQAFDAKYFYQIERPLVYIQDRFGMDLSKIANWIHPGHWSYPAGHGTKFLTAVEVLDDVFSLDTGCKNQLLIAAEVASMGRSGSLIHYPMDNLAGRALTSL